MKCILCEEDDIKVFSIIDSKKYWKCNTCFVKFMDKEHYLKPKDEKEHYLNHKNKITDKNYRNFLSRLTIPLKNKINNKLNGLDYGCGNGPALADMLKKDGYNINIYDPYFFPNKNIFSKKYDFITCTETVEHFFNPIKEFLIFDQLLNNKGWLGIMTCFSTTDEVFEKWHYRRDPTHVIFYQEKSFEIISKKMGWTCEIISKDIALMQKN